jgi:hypothetical protein
MTSETTPQVFMSYARADDEYLGGAVTRLRKQLEPATKFLSGRSIDIFQDIEGIRLGENIQQRISDSLNTTSLLLPIITPSYLASDWCRDEFKSFLQRERALGRNDLIIPIYYQDEPRLNAAMQHPTRAQPSDDEIINELAPRLVADWRNLRGQSDDALMLEIERIAERIIQVIEDIKQTAPDSKFISLGLFTEPPSGVWPENSVIDWSDLFDPVAPSPRVWQEKLLPELKSHYKNMRTQDVKLIQLHVTARISAALAFGYTFRETTGIQIEATDQRDQHWRTGGCTSNTHPLQESIERINRSGTDLTVEISAVPTQSTEGSVSKWLADTQPSVRERLKFALPTQENITEEQAIEIACQIRAAIAETRHSWIPNTTHLFGAMPAGLAVVVGWHLNTFEPIQCYEFVRGMYQPSCQLG